MSLRTTVLRTGGIVALTLVVAASSLVVSPDMAFAKKKKNKDRPEAPLAEIAMCFYHKHDLPVLLSISAGDKRLDNTNKYRAPVADPNNPGQVICVVV